MFPQEFASVVLGLTSALVWGAGDFCGGLGARRASILSVLIIAEFSGFILLLVAGAIAHEPIPASNISLWSILGGLLGTLGLGALYCGLAVGRAAVVAPVSAVVSVAFPALYSAITEGIPEPLRLVGFGLVVAAIILAGQSSAEDKSNSAFKYGLLSGVGFGGFFLFISFAGDQGSTFFPLALARGTTIPFLLILALIRGVQIPPRNVFPVIILSGILDASGNVFFLLSSVVGRLDVATILASLYPASTVILSRLILHEKTTRLQQAGVVLALIAVVLIAA